MRTSVTVSALAGVALLATVFARQGGRPLRATLEGPGGATGSAEIRASMGEERVCYELSASGLSGATAAHVHLGSAGASGPAVMTLATPASGRAEGCVNVNRALVRDLLDAPADYYVDVHAPKGSLRGQLSR